MGKVKQKIKTTTKTKYRKSKTTKVGNRRRCSACGRFL